MKQFIDLQFFYDVMHKHDSACNRVDALNQHIASQVAELEAKNMALDVAITECSINEVRLEKENAALVEAVDPLLSYLKTCDYDPDIDNDIIQLIDDAQQALEGAKD